MKNRVKYVAIIVALFIIVAISIAVSIVIVKKQSNAPRTIDAFYKNDAKCISNIYVSNGIKDEKILLESKYYDYVVEYFKNYTFYPESSIEDNMGEWNYMYAVTTENKSVRMLFYDGYCEIDGNTYTYENSSETSLNEAWYGLLDSMSDYDRMMSYLRLVREDSTEEEIRSIMGTHDTYGLSFSSGYTELYYNFGKYRLEIDTDINGVWLRVYNRETGDDLSELYTYVLNGAYVYGDKTYKYKLYVSGGI